MSNSKNHNHIAFLLEIIRFIGQVVIVFWHLIMKSYARFQAKAFGHLEIKIAWYCRSTEREFDVILLKMTSDGTIQVFRPMGILTNGMRRLMLEHCRNKLVNQDIVSFY